MATIFTDGTVYAKSKLDMINDCLLAIGEVPFNENTNVAAIPLGTDGEIAKRMVEKTMVEIQSQGWYFNTDYDFEIVPDIDGFITLPPNTLRVDFGETEFAHRYIERGGRIYDNKDHTYVIGKNLEADIVWLVDYDQLPPEAYEYISTRAARKFQQKVIGAVETDQFTMRDEQEAHNNLMRRQLQTQDYRIQSGKISTRTHNGYLIEGLYGSKSRRNF